MAEDSASLAGLLPPAPPLPPAAAGAAEPREACVYFG